MKVKPLFKQVGALLLAFILALTLLPVTSLVAFAGSSMDSDTWNTAISDDYNRWMGWMDGTRLTAIYKSNGAVVPGLKSVDWISCVRKSTNSNYWGETPESLADQVYSFDINGKKCKQQYRGIGETAVPLAEEEMGIFQYKTPPGGELPEMIIANSATNNIAAIRDYFEVDSTIMSFCADVFDYNPSVNADGIPDLSDCPEAQALYRRFQTQEVALAIEPLTYFRWLGDYYVATATEIGLLAKQTDPDYTIANGKQKMQLLWRIGKMTHRGIPDSLFLSEAHPEWGYSARKPTPSGEYYSNAQIIDRCLGLGIVWLKSGADPTPTVYHHIYNLRINAPKGATFTTGGQTIPLTASNIAKILNGETITVDGTAVKLSLSMLTDLLRYCMNNGYISNGTGGTLGDGNWDEVIEYKLDKSASNSGFSKDAAGNLIYKVSEDDKFAAQMSSRGVPYLILSSEVTEAVGADNKIYPGPETGNKDIVHLGSI